MAINIKGGFKMKIINMFLINFFLILLFSGCGIAEQSKGLEGDWSYWGENGYKELLSFTKEGDFSWTQYQNENILFQSQGKYDKKMTYASSKDEEYVSDSKDGHWKDSYQVNLIPIVTLITDIDTEDQKKYTLQYVVAGDSLYLIENSSTMYIRQEVIEDE